MSALIYSTLGMSTEKLIPSNPETITYLEYNIEFSPATENYDTTRLGITLNKDSSESDLIEVTTNYENTEILVTKKNYMYAFSKDSRVIISSNLDLYDEFIEDTHIDFLLNEDDLISSPYIRIDEVVDFSDYFLRGISKGLVKIDTQLVFQGTQTIENKFNGNIEVYNFKLYHNWETQGTTPDAIANWTLNGEVLFEKTSGVLISKSLMIKRVDMKPR